MSIRAAEFLIFSMVLLSPSFLADTIAPWLPAKDALVTVPPAVDGHPAATYVRFPATGDIPPGRRLPAVFLIKTPQEEEVIAYLTGIDGQVDEGLQTKITEGDKILWEYLIRKEKPEELDAERLKEGNSQQSQLPPPFDKLRITGFQLSGPFLSLPDLAKFSASGLPTPTGKISIFLVAERSEVFQ